MAMILSLIVGFVLGMGALLFALQNTQVVALTFLGWQFESSLALLVIVALAFGMLISLLASLPSAVSASFRIMGLKRENKNLAQEVEAHRQAKVASTTPDQPPIAPELDLRN